jgi:hypothetical protein
MYNPDNSKAQPFVKALIWFFAFEGPLASGVLISDNVFMVMDQILTLITAQIPECASQIQVASNNCVWASPIVSHHSSNDNGACPASGVLTYIYAYICRICRLAAVTWCTWRIQVWCECFCSVSSCYASINNCTRPAIVVNPFSKSLKCCFFYM